jgi:hypothetical protein
MKVTITILLATISLSCFAQVFDWNENCVKAYHDVISLKINKAQPVLNAEKIRNPQNLVPLLIENYIDFFVLFLNEDPAERKARIGNWESRLNAIDAAPDNVAFKKFASSVINLQWAVVEMKFGNKWSAGWAFRDAFKQAKQNQAAFPNFTPNLIITGPMQMAAATIPKNYRWLSNLLGIKGTMQQGIASMKQFMASTDTWANLYREEGIFYQCYMQFYLLNQPEEALQFISTNQLDTRNNHLFTYMAANLYLNNKQSGRCKTIVLNRNTGAEYLNTGIWDYELAYAKLFHLEPDAGQYLERYLANFKGDFYVKDCWLKLALFYYLNNNTSQYKRCITNTLKRGAAKTDADKRALKEANIDRPPNVMLLKARFLNDGGFYQEALGVLAGKSSNDFTKDEDKLEFMYRVARIYDDLNRYDEALKAYQATINFGKERTEYFAARAALQCGLIYEKQGNMAKAIAFYQQCIDMDDHDYKDSLDQKAKTGLARCTGKN